MSTDTWEPAWSSEFEEGEGPNYFRAVPDDPDPDPDDELDEQVSRADAEQYGEAPNFAPPSGPGTFLKWAVGGATVLVTALGTFVIVGPFAALVPIGAGVVAAGSAVRSRRNRAGGAGGAARRRRMNGAGGGAGGGRSPRGSRSTGAGRGGGGSKPSGGGRKPAAGGGRKPAGGGRPAAGAKPTAGGRKPAAAKPTAGTKPTAGGGRKPAGGGRPAAGAKPTAGGRKPAAAKPTAGGGRPGAGGAKPTGSARRAAMQGGGGKKQGTLGKIGAALKPKGRGTGTGPAGSSSRGPGSTSRGGAHRSRRGGRGGAGQGSTPRTGARGGNQAPQGARSGAVPAARRTMRQRAARVGGDFARGLWAIPSYPTKKAARGARVAGRGTVRGARAVGRRTATGARAGARRVWNAPGPARLRQATRTGMTARVVRPMRSRITRRLATNRLHRRRQQQFYMGTWWPRQGRRLLAPGRWVRHHVRDDAAAYRRHAARAWAGTRSRGRRAWAGTRALGRRMRGVWAARLRRARTRLTPHWWAQIQNLAAVNGRAALFVMAFTAMQNALVRWALGHRRRPAPTAATPPPRPPQPQPAAAGPKPRGARPGTPATAPRPAGTAPSMPLFPPIRISTATPTPAPAFAAAAPAAAGGTMPTATGQTVDISIPANLHPSLGRILEASYRYTANFHPLSPPDLHTYLESQPYEMKVLSDIYRSFGNRLAATFPRVTLVHSFFASVANGFAAQQGPAHELFRGWEILHAEDLARFRSPDVNEHYADVGHHGVSVANVPVIGNSGLKWHAHHTIMMEVTRTQLAGLQFGGQDDDKVRELLNWLDSLPLFFDCLCRHTLALARWLMMNAPVDIRFADFYMPLARGYLSLADQSLELSNAYRTRAQGDVRRREQPRPNEAWFDFANQARTGA